MTKIFTFTKGEQVVNVAAANYDEALENLVFKAGSEEEANEYTFKNEIEITGPIIVGYNNTDEFGADGWWEEGKSEDAVEAAAETSAKKAGFDAAPSLTCVDLSKLETLSKNEFSDLFCQWRLARRNGWASDVVSALIKIESARRVETL